MMYSFEVAESLAEELKKHENNLQDIVKLGLREHRAQQSQGFVGAAEVIEFLAKLPSPEEILALKPSESMQDRVSYLLRKSKSDRLTPEEEAEWEKYTYIEHLVRMAKISARGKLKKSQ